MANLPTRNNNPGDLKNPATGTFEQFKDPQQGFQALQNDILGKMSGTTKTGLNANSTLKDFAYTWAPPSDNNNSDQYAQKLATQLGVTTDTPIGSLKSRVSDFAKAIAANEGFAGGTAYADTVNSYPLAQKIKAKFPQYNDIPDEQLQQKILMKYPQYTDLANPQAAQSGTGPAVTAPKENLGQNLAARLSDASNAIAQGTQGQINPASAVLQSVGAVAGGVGDVVNAGLNKIPGVSSLEEGFNNIVGSLAKTSVGQSIVQAGMDVAAAHPEVAGDLGAVMNIASVLPMFKGVSLFKGAAMDAVSTTFQNRLSGAATKELSEAMQKTITGRGLLEGPTKRGLNPIATIIGKPGARFLPDVSVGADGIARYSTSDSWGNLSSSLSQDEAHLEQMLKGSHDSAGISLDQVQKESIAMAKKDLYGNPDSGKIIATIKKDFQGIKDSIGGKSYVDTKDLNDIKRSVRSSVNFKSDALDENSRYVIGQAMMKKIEQTAEKNGVKGVRDLNKKMASKIEAMKVLKHLDGKKPPQLKPHGIIRQTIAGGLTAGGEAAGNSVGLPFAGALIGRGATGLVRRTPGHALKALNRVGESGGIGKGISKGAGLIAAPGLTQALTRKSTQ